MVNLKNRLTDQVLAYIKRLIKFEICAVDKVHWHRTRGDKDYNVSNVVMRDRRLKQDTVSPSQKDFPYVRQRCPTLQEFGGKFAGHPVNPRRGNLVKVFFYKQRKGLILDPIHSKWEPPVCRPDPYTQRTKYCQYRPLHQDENKDFPVDFPDPKKPVCENWQHGPCNGDKSDDEREPTIGRDYWFMYDFCQEGDKDPPCDKCTSIDWPKRTKNSWRKAYSADTMSCESPNRRLEDHVYCGSYHRFESENGRSIEYSEGVGHIREGNAVCESDKRGHINFKGNKAGGAGTIDVHAMHEEVAYASEHVGARMSVVSEFDDSVNWAYEAIKFEKDAWIRIYKDGKITIHTPEKILIESTSDEVHIKAATQIKLEAPLIYEQTDLEHNTGNEQTDGTCTHAGCSCPCCIGNGWVQT